MIRELKKRIIQGRMRPFYRWHRRVGMVFLPLILILCVTGIVLNHNVSLGLHTTPVDSTWLKAYYNMPQEEEVSEWGGYPTDQLTWDRVMLDIHTGRIVGDVGVWLMDLAAIAMIILSVTGAYMWWRRAKPKNKIQHKDGK